MTQQIMNARNSMVLVPKTRPFALTCKRLLAWSIEVGLVVMSAAIPWGLGHHMLVTGAKTASVSEMIAPGSTPGNGQPQLVDLNPLLKTVQQGWARTAQIPPHQLYAQVPQWTNLLWTAALILPMGVAGGQLLQLSRTGSTWPKRWLGIQVFSMVGGTLLLRQVAGRELLRWGVPMVLVGGVSLITGSTFGLWTPAVVALLAILEGCSAIAPDNRAWHDRLARTRTALTNPDISSPKTHGSSLLDRPIQKNVTLMPQSNQLQLYGETSEDDWWLTEAEGNLTSLVLPPGAGLVKTAPAGALVLPKGSRRIWWLLATGLLFTGAIGFGMGRAMRLSTNPQAREDIFLETAQQLLEKGPKKNEAALLMLAQVEDPRVATYLTDLLSQTTEPETLATLQQALISQGLESIPSLLALSRGLESDLQQPLDQYSRNNRLAQRHAVQGAIARLLAVHSNNLGNTNLDRVNLSLYHDSERTFRLIQPGLMAAGTSWRGANLNQANLTQAQFFDAGPDGKPNSYDDIISQLSDADLTAVSLEKANLQGAQLDGANLQQANLTDAQLPYSNLTGAQLENAHLMHINATKSRWSGSNLVGADLTQAIFDHANVRQARLNRINATHSRWLKADLAQSNWVGSNLMGADFSHANLAEANFQSANLDGANFHQADLRRANLRDTDLRHVTLTGVTLTDADLGGAIFDGGQDYLNESFITPNAQAHDTQPLQGVNFSRVRNLDSRQLNYICAQGGLHPACGQ